VLAVPPKKKPDGSDNRFLNAAFQTRVKLFFRPEGLPFSAEVAPEKLEWRLDDDGLRVYNPTPYYISLVDISWPLAAAPVLLTGQMVAPFSQRYLPGIEKTAIRGVKNISYNIINDQGGLTHVENVIQ
jgi:chaperone protein EcpD